MALSHHCEQSQLGYVCPEINKKVYIYIQSKEMHMLLKGTNSTYKWTQVHSSFIYKKV